MKTLTCYALPVHAVESSECSDISVYKDSLVSTQYQSSNLEVFKSYMHWPEFLWHHDHKLGTCYNLILEWCGHWFNNITPLILHHSAVWTILGSQNVLCCWNQLCLPLRLIFVSSTQVQTTLITFLPKGCWKNSSPKLAAICLKNYF